MKVALLPNLEICRSAHTLGPSGDQIADINGKAVAIECFLDIWNNSTSPRFRWTGYNSNRNAYQGELVHKDEYVREFLEAAERRTSYNYEGLTYLWNYLIDVCTGVTQSRHAL